MTQTLNAHRHKSYLPSPVLRSYAAEKILFEEFREQHNLHGEALQYNKKYRAIKKHKSDLADKIFESMANLMFFFDVLNRSSVLQDDLSDIAMQVTGVVRNNEPVGPPPDDYPRDPYFKQLLVDMVGGGPDLDFSTYFKNRELGRPTRDMSDFQVLIAEMMHSTSSGVFEDVAGTVLPAPEDAYEIPAPFISQDIHRAFAWAVTMSRKARASIVELDEKARVIDIPNLSELLEARRPKFNEEVNSCHEQNSL